ncbi:MAG: prepilin-type N-terminal cleavage/methylation domain-containing protein [Patescibacteria group bacterium]
MIKKIENKKGFTLIETLVAITILLLSIVGPLQIAAQALFSAFYSREEITAYYLAEESIEYIKNARDTRFLVDVFNSDGTPVDGGAWLYGLDECVADPSSGQTGCRVDATKSFIGDPDAIVSCMNSAPCPNMLFNQNTGIWSYNSSDPSAVPSRFNRTVVIIPQSNNGTPTNNEEALIEATVTWTSSSGFGAANRKVTVKALMTNWERK